MVKWIMRYFCGTFGLRLTFSREMPLLVGYTNSNMVGCVDSHKSTLGYLITFGGRAIASSLSIISILIFLLLK